VTLPGLSIVIPSHNRPDLIRACLRSVRASAPTRTQLLVVDDASPGAAVSAAASQFPGVEIIRLEHRGGFCIAANIGIAAATQPIVELLNDDTEVCPGWAEAALNAFAEDRIAAVAPLVLRWPNKADNEVIVDSAGDHYHVGGYASKRGHGQRLSAEHLCPRFVFGASASSVFYRRDLLVRLGAFPESFGAYFEDVDVAFRIHRAGYRVWFEPASRVLHHVSASHGSRPGAALVRQQSRNEELVYWRNLPNPLLSLPLHLLVLLGKAWRRWRNREFLPFMRGRFDVLSEIPQVLRHRRWMRRLGRSERQGDLRRNTGHHFPSRAANHSLLQPIT
jgi:GT2 family glycosyltransferase